VKIVALLALGTAACAFEPRGDVPGDGDAAAADAAAADGAVIDAAVIDAAVIDAAVDAPIDARAIDARTCPTAPGGCTPFACAGSTSCYYLCVPAAGWTAANLRCTSAGLGCLATIGDAAENTCIAAATAPSFPNLIWFGWRQSPSGGEPSGGWGWQCGTSPFVAGNWGSGEPNNSGGNEDCGAMATGGGWIDGDCGVSFRYVCELP
jgi:hypothetical protein